MIYRLSFTFALTLLLFQKVDGQQTIYFEDSDFNFKPLLLDGKTTEIRSAFTLSDGTYWVNYVGETGVLVKYEGAEEVYRSEQSIYLNYNEWPTVSTDNSIWIPISTYSIADTNTMFSYRRKFLVIDSENVESILDEGEVFDGGRLLHHDKYKGQYYALGDSLRRYNADFSRDYTFKCEVSLDGVNSVLVNAYGSVFLGNDRFGRFYGSNRTTYKLDYSGKLIWEGVVNKKRNYTYYNSFSDYNMFYPILDKDDFVLWGSLTCGEGCYTSDNHALSEDDEKVSLPYLKIKEYYPVGTDFIDKYGVTLKNRTRFMKYDSLNKVFDQDDSVLIDLQGKYIMDILPDSSILVMTSAGLSRYTTKINPRITTEIVNLKEASDDFFEKKVIDVRGDGIDLEIITSDSSDSYVLLEPTDTKAAYVEGKRLVFTGEEGDFKVITYSITGSTPYKSRMFKISKTRAEVEVIDQGPLLVNLPFEFKTVQPNVYIDSVGGSCERFNNAITANSYSEEGCTVYYFWGGDENYSKISSSVHFEISKQSVLGVNEETGDDLISYPNPVTNGRAFVISSKEPIFSINAVDGLGRKQLFATRKTGNNIEVTMSNDFSGILFIQMFDKKNNFIGSIKKVIK
ncbi:T9SS type A sorting domain-containing protein [uncultured Arcticibacterium sp.]|uniref:T9SS type A sorting domain-containing protein n=1 Tax=uncultured Arcticibacterium sp. TaxID=2173042 RepID=UPI0030F5C908